MHYNALPFSLSLSHAHGCLRIHMHKCKTRGATTTITRTTTTLMLTFGVAIIFGSQRSLYPSVRSVGIFAAIFASVYGFTSKSFLYLSLSPCTLLQPLTFWVFCLLLQRHFVTQKRRGTNKANRVNTTWTYSAPEGVREKLRTCQ